MILHSRHLTGQERSVIVQRTFCPLHIRCVFVLLVIHPLLIRQSMLLDRSLSVTCPLHIRHSCVLCAPYTFSEDAHRHQDDFHHRMNTGLTIFEFFSVHSASATLIRQCDMPKEWYWKISLMLNLKNIKCLTLETHAHIGWAGGSASDLGSLTERWGRGKS